MCNEDILIKSDLHILETHTLPNKTMILLAKNNPDVYSFGRSSLLSTKIV